MFPILGIRDLKIRLQRRQRECHKTNKSDQQNNNSERAVRFFVHFFYRHCSPTTRNFLVSRFTEDVNTRQQFSFSFSDLRYSPLESTPEKFPNIWQNEWNGRRKFAAAAVARLLKLPIKLKEKLKEAAYISVYMYREYLVLREETGLKHSDARDWKYSRRVVIKDRGLWISPGYFYGKIEEKRNPPKKSLAVLYPGHLLHLPGNVKF